MTVQISQIRNWQLGDMGSTATDLRASATTLDTSAVTLINRLQGISTDWQGEARDKAGLEAEDKSATMQQKAQRLQTAAAIIETAAAQMKLLRDSVLGLVDDPGNHTKFSIADDGTVKITAHYASQLQLLSNCNEGVFNAWMAQAEIERRDLQRKLTTQLQSADSAGQFYDWQVTNALMGVTAAERPFSPRIPPPPPKPAGAKEAANEDGSGPGSYDSWDPGLLDKVSLQQLRTIAESGSWASSPATSQSSALLNHYFDNSGTDYRVNVNQMLKDMPAFRKESAEQARIQFDAVKRDLPEGYTGPVAFQGGYDGQYRPSLASNPDWNASLGTYSYQASGVATPTSNEGYHLTYQTSIYDFYNWDSTGKSPSSQYSDLNNLNLAGWAQTFDTVGTSGPQATTWP
ncbi:UNVERIFIED_CONTAM: hypothetical protein DES50_10574 [Williamsia faeni]